MLLSESKTSYFSSSSSSSKSQCKMSLQFLQYGSKSMQ